MTTAAQVRQLDMPPRIRRLRERMLGPPRHVSVEQALLVTASYERTQGRPRIIRRAEALAETMRGITIRIDPEELIVGNRTPEARAGVVLPEAAVEWIDREIETLPTREQDSFDVRCEDVEAFRRQVLPRWRGRTLADRVYQRLGAEVLRASSVVKVNQRDHAQGHIIPNVRTWLSVGPAGLYDLARRGAAAAGNAEARSFHQAVCIVLSAACDFARRLADLAERTAADAPSPTAGASLRAVARNCRHLAAAPPETFHEAVQSVWLLFVLLHMESNASSFSPGRLDQYLLPYLQRDLRAGRIDPAGALEVLEALWLKFNQIVYMRSAASARYFAGFPIGFNVCIGGLRPDGADATNVLSHLCLKAQEHVHLPQPNLSARLHDASPDEFLDACAAVIGLGGGMPQVFNDASVIPALRKAGIEAADAVDYGVVGCVELSPQGSALGFSDAAMLNMVKVLELSLNDGRCMLTGRQLGPRTGRLVDFGTFGQLERAYDRQMDHFVGLMMAAVAAVDRAQAEMMPSPLLSSVVDDCLRRGVDVTAGGARYNLCGVQGVQVANVADSLAAMKLLVFDEARLTAAELMEALQSDFAAAPALRQRLIHRVPKYGNDVEWVDRLGCKWAERFARKVGRHRNARGGCCHAGFYTVSAHVPMGANVAATPDGRSAGEPLADGGLSAMRGRDRHGPTALLHSAARIDSLLGSNGRAAEPEVPAGLLPPRGGPPVVRVAAARAGGAEDPPRPVQRGQPGRPAPRAGRPRRPPPPAGAGSGLHGLLRGDRQGPPGRDHRPAHLRRVTCGGRAAPAGGRRTDEPGQAARGRGGGHRRDEDEDRVPAGRQGAGVLPPRDAAGAGGGR